MWQEAVFGDDLLPIIISLLVLFTTRAVLFGGGALLWVRFSKWAQKNLIYTKESIPLSWRLDGLPAISTLLLDSVLVGLAIWIGLFRLEEETTWTHAFITFSIYYIWYELYFYYTHRLFHLPKFFWIHRLHHERRATNGMTSLAFSIPERLILIFGAVVLPGFVSQVYPLSGPAIGFYFLYNYVMNVCGHLNVEIMPRTLLEGSYGRVMSTTLSHSMHHQVYKGNFGLFTQVLDRWHQTEIRS